MLYTEFEKQGMAVFLLLPQNICECVRCLLIADITWAEGWKLIINKLDEIYLGDLNTSAYMAFKDFHCYKRNIGINKFLVHCEFLYQKLQKIWYDTPLQGAFIFGLNAAN